jgi:hypothetical protein
LKFDLCIAFFAPTRLRGIFGNGLSGLGSITQDNLLDNGPDIQVLLIALDIARRNVKE